MTATILIVDDEKNIRRTVRMVLEGEGYLVEEATSGEEALARLPDVAPDLILLDVQLPGISGLDMLESLKKAKGDEASRASSLVSIPLMMNFPFHDLRMRST